MIPLATEAVITLSQARRFLPRRSNGKPVAPSTLYRWSLKGVRGVRLETLKVGGMLCTSREALQRFCDRITDQDGSDIHPMPHRPSSVSQDTKDIRRRLEVIEKAEAELEAAGI